MSDAPRKPKLYNREPTIEEIDRDNEQRRDDFLDEVEKQKGGGPKPGPQVDGTP